MWVDISRASHRVDFNIILLDYFNAQSLQMVSIKLGFCSAVQRSSHVDWFKNFEYDYLLCTVQSEGGCAVCAARRGVDSCCVEQ